MNDPFAKPAILFAWVLITSGPWILLMCGWLAVEHPAIAFFVSSIVASAFIRRVVRWVKRHHDRRPGNPSALAPSARRFSVRLPRLVWVGVVAIVVTILMLCPLSFGPVGWWYTSKTEPVPSGYWPKGGIGWVTTWPPDELSTATLLWSDLVQKELKISDEQRETIKAVLMSDNRRVRELAGIRALPRDERDKAIAELWKRIDEDNKRAEEILNADQLKRVNEISLQVNRIAVNVRKTEIANLLSLSAMQTRQIQTIYIETHERLSEIYFPPGNQRFEEMEEVSNDAEVRCAAILSDEQRAQLGQMKGTKFEFTSSSLLRPPTRKSQFTKPYWFVPNE
ncbi:MAG: hypothetical protein ACKV0T_04115 [Planctomycetales bacterium]